MREADAGVGGQEQRLRGEHIAGRVAVGPRRGREDDGAAARAQHEDHAEAAQPRAMITDVPTVHGEAMSLQATRGGPRATGWTGYRPPTKSRRRPRSRRTWPVAMIGLLV